ncbi:hypothetical protein NXV14_01660 [Bacteroides fragilis]|nr:hypothetical protein [Bacteroides fragilis]UVR35189.1 hypothetical protein NXY10_07285 [Bacteroides fragilis]
MEITYNIQTVYTYHEKDMPAGKTKVHIFSRKVSRRIWKYALSTPDFRSFLEAKSLGVPRYNLPNEPGVTERSGHISYLL